MNSSAKGRLLICPTPIGNLDDITLRVLRSLAEADLIACEDTRHTRKLLARHAIKADLVSYHEHNERRRAQELVERMRQGQVIALVSDAGMPAISDPGALLIKECRREEIEVEVLPGPSAVTAAVVASGLAAESWCFIGFLPRTAAALIRLLGDHEGETLVAFESPKRIAKTLKALAAGDPSRQVAVCRELTKVYEEVVTGSAEDVAARFSGETKGEIVLVLGKGANSRDEADLAKLVVAVGQLVDSGAKLRQAAKVVASISGEGVRPNDLYARYMKQNR